MTRPVFWLALAALGAASPAEAPAVPTAPAVLATNVIPPVEVAGPLRFEVRLDPAVGGGPVNGRLFVAMARTGGRGSEPRRSIGRTGIDAPPVVAIDVASLKPGESATLGGEAASFPINRLADLPPGEYRVQAVLDRPNDTRDLDAPGNLVGPVVTARLDPADGGVVTLTLDRVLPPKPMPADTDRVKHIEMRSECLSAFHGRDFTVRAGVILPRGWADEPDRRYPLRVHIGGYGSRYTNVDRMMSPGSPFRAAWDADDAPRMILLHLDGDGPLGDPYQVDSAGHGPYGQMVTKELIPHVEKRYRGRGDGRSRVLDGGSTGGWVSLALQVFYPNEFAGAWSSCPDGVDFRSFQLVNIYDDANAYINPHGFERPAARDLDGDVQYTMRHECRLENLLGPGNNYALSGGQWGAWNATYGPLGADGKPVPLWNPATGKIDRSVVEHWRKYDLRHVLQRDWPTLGPKLRGKLHIWVGEADDYFLNNAVHRLDEFFKQADPPADATIVYGPGEGHCWRAIDEAEILRQMGEATKPR